jgi:hypothetical protein
MPSMPPAARSALAAVALDVGRQVREREAAGAPVASLAAVAIAPGYALPAGVPGELRQALRSALDASEPRAVVLPLADVRELLTHLGPRLAATLAGPCHGAQVWCAVLSPDGVGVVPLAWVPRAQA